MAHIHDTHGHYESDAAAGFFGFTSGVMLAIMALVLVVVIVAAVLLTARLWNSSSPQTAPNLPIPQQGGGGAGGTTR